MNPINGKKNNTSIHAQVEEASFLSKKMIVMARIIFNINKMGMKGIELIRTLILTHLLPPVITKYYIVFK